jgi:catechol 2,3-dioxygenase-like lactoylglutathione lyase family enzyme
MINVNGIAHIQLTVRDVGKSTPFYEKLLHALGMTTIIKSDQYFYCVGSRTGVAISPADPDRVGDGFDQLRLGLHHLCFRARSREDVDAIHKVAVEIGANIVHPPQEDGFAPGYYSVLFEDPDGIRIEANFVPGKGHLEKDAKLPLDRETP